MWQTVVETVYISLLELILEGRFLSCCRKNSEMRQGGQESKVMIYLSDSMLSRGEQEVSGE